MLTMRQFVYIILVALGTLFSGAQTLRVDDTISRWEVGFNAGLNSDGYEFDFRGLWFPTQYAGLKLGIGAASEIGELSDWIETDEWESQSDHTTRFKFNPAIVLRSPRIIDWKKRGAGFYIFAEPGIILSHGASGSRGARTFCLDIKAGINMQIERFIVTLGYGASDFQLYSGFPHDTSPLTHTVFIGGAYKL